MGRPRIEITSDMIAEAERLAARGLTKEQIAYCLGIGSSTLFEKLKEYPEFSEALKKGKALGISDVANALYEAAMGGSIPGMIWYLKNRDPSNWKDRPEPYNNEDATPPSLVVHVVDGRKKDEDGNPIEYEFGKQLKEEAA